MEQQYDYSQIKPQPKPQDSPRRRVWRSWTPLLVKLGITYLVSCLFSAAFISEYLIREFGEDMEAMSVFIADAENKWIITEYAVERAMDFVVHAEALAALITIPILLFMFRRDKIRRKIAGVMQQKKKVAAVHYIWILLASATLCIALNNLIFISDLASYSESYQQTMESLYNAPIALQLLTLGILVPVCEELVFRGLMFNRVKEYGGYKSAMFFTTFVFAILHMNFVQMIYAAIMGLLFAFLYEKYGSFKAPALAHISANVVSVLATHFKIFDWLMQDFLRIAVLTVICAAAAATAYVLIQRIEDVYEENEPVAE